LSGGSIVGSIAPHQAFAIGGPNSVRGYGEGAVGCGQSYLASKTELAIPLVYIIMLMLIIPYLAIDTNFLFLINTLLFLSYVTPIKTMHSTHPYQSLMLAEQETSRCFFP